MNNFELVILDERKQNIIVVMKTSEAPFEFVYEIQESLKSINFVGKIIIDELLHSGNTKERFISGYFDGDTFTEASFKYELVEKRSEIRSYICEYLSKDNEILDYCGLTEKQQELIRRGFII